MDASLIQSQPAAAFSLANLEAAETGLLEVQNQTDTGPLLGNDGKPVTVELYGPGSEAYLRVEDEIDRDRQARMMKAAMKRGGASADSYVNQRGVLVKKLTATTKGFSANFPFTPAEVYGNPRLGWLTAQVARFGDDWANFPNPSVTS